MRYFNITINGKVYQVACEEVSQGTAPVAAPAPVPAAAPAAAPAAPAAPEAPKATVAEGATAVNAPMPGNILAVNVKSGDTVKSGTVLCILEAMKMENEVLAPKDGVVDAVAVQKGSTVNAGDLLVSIR